MVDIDKSKSGTVEMIAIWNVCELPAPLTSVTEMAKLYDPAVVGVPLKMPLGSSIKPAGRFPLVTAHWYGGVPPDAVRFTESAVPVAVDASVEDVVIVTDGGGAAAAAQA